MRNKSKKSVAAIIKDNRAVTTALRAGVREALVRHRKAGEPVAEWRNGKTVWLGPKEIDQRIKEIDDNGR
jgi:hypothetical protein